MGAPVVQTNLARPTRVERRPLWWRLGHEALLLGALWMVYTLGRALAGSHVGSAYGHATQIWRLERDLRLPDEARVQRWALSHPDLIQLANHYYKFEHWVALSAVACWLLVARPERYLWFRRVLVLTTALALAGHFGYPLMPPRMRPDFGLVDTGVQFGQSVYGPNYANHGLVNQYAAMPSMHVGWAVLFAVTVVLAARTPWRWLVVLYPGLTTWVVVATGNHYWLDGVAGALLLGLALLAVHRLRPAAGQPLRPGFSSRGSRSAGGGGAPRSAGV